MPDLTELLRQSAAAEAASYEPPAALPQRIAQRTLQLQRRRRARIVGAAFGLVALAVPLIVHPTRHSSNAVNIAYGPTPVTAKEAKATTTTTTAPVRLLDLQAFIDNGVKQRNEVLRKLAVALKKQRARDSGSKRDDAEVLDASAAGDPASRQAGPANGSAITSRASTTSTTGASTTTTTTTTTSPPPIYVPLAIVAPDHVCAGVPAVFRATGTGADRVVWSNSAVGATATYVLTESTTVVARLDFNGVMSSQAVGVQVIPTGTSPC